MRDDDHLVDVVVGIVVRLGGLLRGCGTREKHGYCNRAGPDRR